MTRYVSWLADGKKGVCTTMRRITLYSQWVIDKTVRYFGRRCDEYKDNIIRTYDGGKLEEQLNISDECSDIRYHYLFEYMDMPELAMTFHLAVAQYEYPAFGRMIKELTGFGVNLKLAMSIMDIRSDVNSVQVYKGYIRLRRLLAASKEEKNYLYTAFEADRRMVLYLEGSDYIAEELAGAAKLYIGDARYDYFSVDDKSGMLAKLIEDNINVTPPFVIQISGKKGSGRRTLLKRAADRCGVSAVFIDFKRICDMEKQMPDIFRLAIREACLYDGIICFYNICDEEDADGCIERLMFETDRRLDDFSNPVIMCTGADVSLAAHTDLSVYNVRRNSDDLKERIAVWEGYSAKYDLELNASYYGMKYLMTPERISKIVEKIDGASFNRMTVNEQERYICNLCTDIISLPEKGSIIPASGDFTFDDLKISDEQMRMLKNVCAHFKQGYKVLHEWNMIKSFQYGRGTTVLFAGPPGTGKTMAAGCIANEVSLPLYKINLSQVVDKYIGETEKKLETVFKYAQDTNSILFFDEADALFSKRSEVKDAKDKYANTEVSYILQRIEQHDGIVILATNFINNIDEAFMRRMKYIVNFQIPDYGTRLAIWKNIFPKETPLDNVDFEYLAGKIELSGGYIKNIALNAAFYGSRESGGVNMKQILTCAQNEYRKLGKVNSKEFFSDYGFGI